MHAACPAADWYVPPAQREHTDAPAAARSPALHATGTSAPVAQAWPSGHSVQSPAAVRLVPLPYVPAPHSSAALAPAAQCAPRLHASHAVALCSRWYEPAGQGVQLSSPSSGLAVPGAHGVGAVLPVLHALPRGHRVHCSALPKSDALE